MRNIKLLYFINLFLNFKLYVAVGIIFFTQVTNSPMLGMSIFGIWMLSAAIFEIPTGILSDKTSRKMISIFGGISVGISMLFFAFSYNYLTLVIAAILKGLGDSFFSGNQHALLYESIKEEYIDKTNEKFHLHLGRMSSITQIGLALAAALGGIIANFFNIRLTFILTAFAQIIIILLSLFLKNIEIENRKNITSKPSEEILKNRFLKSIEHFKTSLTVILKNKKLLYLAIVQIIVFTSGGVVYQFEPEYIKKLWDISGTGYFRFLTHLATAIGTWISIIIVKRLKYFNTMLFSSIYTVFAYLIGISLNNLITPIIFVSTLLIAGISDTARECLMQKEITDKQRATIGSIVSLFTTAGIALYGLLIGIIAEFINQRFVLLIAVVLEIIALPIYFLYKNNKI